MLEQILPKLIKIGLPIPAGLVFKFKNDAEKHDLRQKEDASNKLTADIAYQMSNAGLKMDPKYFTERTGIPCLEIEPPEPIVEDKKAEPAIKEKLKNLYAKNIQ